MIVVVPDNMSSCDFIDGLRTAFYDKDLHFQEVECFQHLATNVHREWTEITIVDSTEWTLSGTEMSATLRFTSGLTYPSPSENTSTAYLLIASLPAALIPEETVSRGVCWWWGFPSELEMQVLCRLNDNSSSDLERRWREYMLPAICGGDQELIWTLWDVVLLGFNEMNERLRTYATDKGWTVATLSEHRADNIGTPIWKVHSSLSARPPKDYHELWRMGALQFVPEHGLTLNSAALTVLGNESAIKHRIWRAQCSMLLGTLDAIRISICQRLTERYGSDWPVKWSRPQSSFDEEDLRKDALLCQWGHLYWLLTTCPPLRGSSRFENLVRRSRRIRNLLAHLRPVTFNDVKLLYHELALRHLDLTE